ncbi:MAG: hypothetical protein WA055_04895 [Candidatus Moraniibacteriota bacterium]
MITTILSNFAGVVFAFVVWVYFPRTLAIIIAIFYMGAKISNVEYMIVAAVFLVGVVIDIFLLIKMEGGKDKKEKKVC